VRVAPVVDQAALRGGRGFDARVIATEVGQEHADGRADVPGHEQRDDGVARQIRDPRHRGRPEQQGGDSAHDSAADEAPGGAGEMQGRAERGDLNDSERGYDREQRSEERRAPERQRGDGGEAVPADEGGGEARGPGAAAREGSGEREHWGLLPTDTEEGGASCAAGAGPLSLTLSPLRGARGSEGAERALTLTLSRKRERGSDLSPSPVLGRGSG
jgi:hypothetical protein